MFMESMEGQDSPLNLAQQPGWREEKDGWIKVKGTMDSGAAESVTPPIMAANYPVEESVGSKNGLYYVSASGERMPNLGQQVVPVITEDGTDATMTFQVADVTRPLCSVSRICEKGNRVLFGEFGGVIQHVASGREIPFHKENNLYVLTFWIKPSLDQGKKWDFSGQGM